MDSMAAQLRIRELTKGGLRPQDLPELRELAKKVYHQSALDDLILPLMGCLELFYKGTNYAEGHEGRER
jgi:hypothetical protein